MKRSSPNLTPADASQSVPAQTLTPTATADGGSTASASRVSLRTAESRQAGRSPSPYSAMADFTTGSALDGPLGALSTSRGAGSVSGPRPRKKHKKREPCEPKECENCGEMHPGTYGSGRFCSQSCRSRFNGRKMQANPGGHHHMGGPGGGGGRPILVRPTAADPGSYLCPTVARFMDTLITLCNKTKRHGFNGITPSSQPRSGGPAAPIPAIRFQVLNPAFSCARHFMPRENGNSPRARKYTVETFH